MNKSEIFLTFSRYIQQKVLSGNPLATIKELGQLVREGLIKPQEIGYWMREMGFPRLRAKRAGKGFTTEYFLNKEAVEIVKKKNKLGFRCGYTVHLDKKGKQIDFYYVMQPDEEDRWAHYNIKVNVKEAKQQVIFSAKKINLQGDLADMRQGYHGPGMLSMPDNLQGKY